MKKIDNLKEMKNKDKVIIDIPKNVMAMVITYIFIDEKGEVRLITNNIDTQRLKENI